ncbi:MAG: protein kinase [Candidatus Aminicenantes bacterium]|nr:protein kinase [Candidatus Aminicenantes bacterium]
MSNKCPKCNHENPDGTLFCGKCGTQLPAPEKIEVTETMEAPKEELTTGSTYAGRYQIIEELGKGGMGKVYKVNDTKIKEKIALKLIKPEIAKDKKTIERFSNELRLARKIRHKNICQMFDLGEDQGTHFITMEFVPGQDLKGLIRQTGQLAVGTTINIAKQICDGLTEAHKLGVIHRDLKPSNIMIDKEGDVRIMDFGIARSLEAKGITGAGVMIGTPEYMSPEQVEGKEVDQRSDIYSLGVILYEMVTGRVPFEGDTPFTVGVKQKSETPQNPKEINSQIPDDLNQVILRCLEKEKEMRYQSAGELRSELTNIEKGIPTTERVVPERKPLTSREITVTFGLKKLFIPVLVVTALVIVAVIVWQFLLKKEPLSVLPSKPSVAVLPFEDLSQQKDQGYFCDGLADELINRLTKIESLKVPARTSAFSFKGKELGIKEIGKQLNVEMVLEGSLRKAGNKLRITVQLVKVSDGYPLWSEKYERDEADIFALQDEISLAIVDNLKVKLLGEEKEELVKHHTKNLEAYNLYLKGRHLWYKRNEDGLKKAVNYLEQAIEKDPNFALAYAGLADAYNMLVTYHFLSPKEGYPRAEKAAIKALEIDSGLSEAYTALAWISDRYKWNLEEAESTYKHAIQLNPRYVHAHTWYAWCLVAMGKYDEAIVEVKIAQDLDPLSLIINADLGEAYDHAGQYEKAIEQLKRTLELDDNFSRAHDYLGNVFLHKKNYAEAITEFETAIRTSGGSPEYIAALSQAYAAAGKKEDALKILKNLQKISESRFVSTADFALVYLSLDEVDKSLDLLEQAYIERSYLITQLKTDSRFRSLRSNSRFKALLKKVSLELQSQNNRKIKKPKP